MKELGVTVSFLQKDLSRALSLEHFLLCNDVMKFNQFSTFLFPWDSLITINLNPILYVLEFLQNLFFSLKNVAKGMFVPFLDILLDIFQFDSQSKHSCSIHINTPPLLNECLQVRMESPLFLKSKREFFLIIKLINNQENWVMIRSHPNLGIESTFVIKEPVISYESMIQSDLNKILSYSSISLGVLNPMQVHVMKEMVINKVH